MYRYFLQGLRVGVISNLFLLWASLTFVNISGVGIILGKYSKISAFVLALVTIIINYYMHDFWNMSEGLEQRHEMQNFVKNTGIIAGLLILSAVHPGKYKLGQ